MSHNLEQRPDGTFSYVGAREQAWHGLGNTYTGRDGLTVAEVLEDLDAGTIEKLPVHATRLTENGIELIEFPDQVMTVRVRQSGSVGLGIVGPSYQVFSEADSFQFLDNIVDAGACITAAGLLDNGKRAFCCLKLPEQIRVGGVDAIDQYIFAALSHDGSMQVTVGATPIRVVCQNTLTMALGTTPAVYRVRHTARAALNVENARRTLDMTHAYMDVWTAEMEKLLATDCTNAKFATIIDKLYGPGENPTKRVLTNWEKKRDDLFTLFALADTQDAGRHTAYGALNALTEFVDWIRPVRGAGENADTYRFAASLTNVVSGGDVANAKNEALAAVKLVLNI